MSWFVSLLISIQNTEFFADLRGSAYTYPALLALHLCAIALFGAMIMVTDLRLLGVVMRKQPIADVIDQLRWPKRVGFVLAVTCGLLLFFSKAEGYYYNIFFRMKILLFFCVFLHAMIFRGSVYNNAAALDKAPKVPGNAKLAASLSLFLWLGILTMGRAIGYLMAPSGMHFSGILQYFLSPGKG